MSCVIGDKILYQVGTTNDKKLVLSKDGFQGEISGGVKNVWGADNTSSHGQTYLIGDQAAKKTLYEFSIEALEGYDSDFSPSYVQSVFYSKPKLGFFYDYKRDKNSDPNEERPFGKVYFTRLVTSSVPTMGETRWGNAEKLDSSYKAAFKMEPFFYDCSDCVEYIDYVTYFNNLNFWDWDQVPPLFLEYGWDQDDNSWDSFSEDYGLIKELTDEQKKTFFTNIQCGKVRYFMNLRDRFFDRDTTQTARRYIVNQTVSSSSQIDVATSDDLQLTSAECRVMRIELSQMVKDQSVTIINMTNASGITITWDSSTPSPASLVYNTATGELYSGPSEDKVPLTSYSDTIPAQATQMLYFQGLQDEFRIGIPDFEQVRIINSVGTILDIKIDILLAYD